MAVVKRGQHKPRRVPPSKRPKTVIDLIWSLSGDRERAYILIEMIACTVLVCCVPACICVDTVALAMQGTKGLSIGTLLPSGVTGGGWLTYLLIRVRKRVTSRRAAAVDGRNYTPPSADLNHKQGQRQPKRKRSR
jgi:hypothetical protein